MNRKYFVDSSEQESTLKHALSDTQRPGVMGLGIKLGNRREISAAIDSIPVARLGRRGSNMTHRS